MKQYAAGEVCARTGISRKTLFYYDHIGLLKPTSRNGAQNIKYYDADALKRLMQIREYRSAGLQISEIRSLLDEPDADQTEILEHALQRLLQEKSQKETEIKKLQQLMQSMKNSMNKA